MDNKLKNITNTISDAIIASGKKLNEIDEYKLILKDSILLSRCKKVMGGSSNIFFGVLIINNNIEYKLFDILKNSYGL